MKKIIIYESQLRRLMENDFEFGLEYYEQNFPKFENQVKSYYSQVVKFYNFFGELSFSEIVENIEQHEQISKQYEELNKKIRDSHDKLFDIGEKIGEMLEREDEDVFIWSHPLYKRYDILIHKIDDLGMDLDSMIDVYNNMIDTAKKNRFQKYLKQTYGGKTISIEPSDV